MAETATTGQSALDAAASARRAGIALGGTVVVTALSVAVFGAAAYPWVKAVHVIAIIAWMAAMLYLPRLFIYHCDAPKGSVQSETFKLMEYRLATIIMTPAMIVAWVLGLWLAWTGGWMVSGWFLVKLALVIAMSGVHGMFLGAVRRFAEDRNEKSPRYWRIVNEAPTVLMFGAVILVIVKPL
jgi:protoporphyrinogen IX oxidase